MPAKVHINLRREAVGSYDILIPVRLSRAAVEILREYHDRRTFVITDSNVAKLYASTVRRSFRWRRNGGRLCVVPAGERCKSRRSKEALEDRLLTAGAGRDSLLIALGGGMIGDLAGFVAATLHRGVPYIQIPTTLLAQVDSSVGGKVAVDHPLGKNLIGAFYQPERVYIDLAFLKTLPEREFRNGLAEVIKYAAILDRGLFSILESESYRITGRNSTIMQRIIKRCCELKKVVVEKDEREADLRRILNFGHTIGHALEALSRYRMPHGEAVSRGMVAEARMSARLGMLSREGALRLQNLLRLYALPTEIPRGVDFDRLISLTLHDKKARGGVVEYTLLNSIGRAAAGIRLSSSKARSLLRSG